MKEPHDMSKSTIPSVYTEPGAADSRPAEVNKDIKKRLQSKAR
jgi:hypothetical protein